MIILLLILSNCEAKPILLDLSKLCLNRHLRAHLITICTHFLNQLTRTKNGFSKNPKNFQDQSEFEPWGGK